MTVAIVQTLPYAKDCCSRVKKVPLLGAIYGGVGLYFPRTEDECNSGPSYYQEQEPRQPSTVPEPNPSSHKKIVAEKTFRCLELYQKIVRSFSLWRIRYKAMITNW